jgi:hypothetical protein
MSRKFTLKGLLDEVSLAKSPEIASSGEVADKINSGAPEISNRENNVPI